MITLRIAPNEFLRGIGIIARTGEYAARLGNKALVIGGAKSLAAVRDALLPSLRWNGMAFAASEFHGYCSQNNIEKLRREISAGQYDLLIGAGGGRVMDCVKAASNAAKVPLITIPTVAATCAAWTPLSVLYTDQGAYESILEYPNAPHLVIVDYELLCRAPERYLAAGIADSLAKWHEITLNTSLLPRLDLTLTTSIVLSEICNQVLYGNGPAALEAARRHAVTEDFEKTVDAVIFLVGVISGMVGETARLAIGHTIYNCFSYFRSADGHLHGEKVAFGLAVQQVLRGKPEREIVDFIKFIKSLGVPGNLAGFGLGDPEERGRFLDLIAANDTLVNAPVDGSRANLERAFAAVERLAGQERG